MISEEDFSVIEGLDPPIAFVRLERRFRNVLERNLENSQNTQAYNSYLYEYVNHVIAAAQALEIAELDGWQIPDNENEMWEYYKRLITQIDRYAVRIQISNIRQPSRGSVGLEPAERQEVRHYVEQIKTVIEASKLDIAKKNVCSIASMSSYASLIKNAHQFKSSPMLSSNCPEPEDRPLKNSNRPGSGSN